MDDEQKWKLIQEALAAEAQGKPLRPIASRRTLFGIKSSVEETIERVVNNDEAEKRAQRQAANKAKHEEDA